MTRSAREKLSCGASRSSICFHTCTALIFLLFIALSPERRKANPFLCSGGCFSTLFCVFGERRGERKKNNTKKTEKKKKKKKREKTARRARHKRKTPRKSRRGC